MSNRRAPKVRNHRAEFVLANGHFDEATLRDWYARFNPIGSGPLGVMRAVCALLEEVAELKGIDLTKESK